MNMKKDRYLLALTFWTSALQYLRLVENVATETVSQGNTWALVRDYSSGSITEEEYSHATRWSDHSIIIPLIFNLLHGIELLSKGFLLADPEEPVGKTHKISALRNRIAAMYPGENVMNVFLSKYTVQDDMPELLVRFLDVNKLSVDQLYQAFRYPSPDFEETHSYADLKYQGEAGTLFFEELAKDIKELRFAAIRLGRRLEPIIE
jgi:hypothetical protein